MQTDWAKGMFYDPSKADASALLNAEMLGEARGLQKVLDINGSDLDEVANALH